MIFTSVGKRFKNIAKSMIRNYEPEDPNDVSEAKKADKLLKESFDVFSGKYFTTED